MGEVDLWALAWKLLAASFAAVVLTIGGCSVMKTAALTGMVRSGADPIEAACALDIGDGKSLQCALLVAKKK